MVLSFVFAWVILRAEALIVQCGKKFCLNFRWRCYFHTLITQKGISNSATESSAKIETHKDHRCEIYSVESVKIYYSMILHNNHKDNTGIFCVAICSQSKTVKLMSFITVVKVKSKVKQVTQYFLMRNFWQLSWSIYLQTSSITTKKFCTAHLIGWIWKCWNLAVNAL